MRAWACSDAGRVRRHNQDAFLIDPDLGLFVVADGMGGGARGEVASGLACNALRERIALHRRDLEDWRAELSDTHADEIEGILEQAVQAACREVYDAGAALAGEVGRLGSTLDVVWVIGNQAFTAHVGDSRIYLVRGGNSEVLTEDHTMVREKLRRGLITEEEAELARNRSVITRAIGVQPRVHPDLLRLELALGDKLLLCSDGLYRKMTAETFVQLLASTRGSTAVEVLVDIANQRGGQDNITALVVEVTNEGPAPPPHGFAPHIKALRACELFSYCTWNELARIAEVCRVKDIPPGAWVFKEGQPGRECYVIDRGEVQVIKQDKVRYTLGPGRIFGEMSFIDVPRRTASVRTSVPTRVLMLSRRDFLQLIRQDADLGNRVQWQMLRQLARLLRGG